MFQQLVQLPKSILQGRDILSAGVRRFAFESPRFAEHSEQAAWLASLRMCALREMMFASPTHQGDSL